MLPPGQLPLPANGLSREENCDMTNSVSCRLWGPMWMPLFEAFSKKLVRMTQTENTLRGISGTTGEAFFLGWLSEDRLVTPLEMGHSVAFSA